MGRTYFLFHNNLVRYGTYTLFYDDYTSGTPVNWIVRDNLFAGTTNATYSGNDSTNIIVRDHNGFTADTTGNIESTATSANGDVLDLTADFQVGSLGEYYYPSSGTNFAALIDVGSQDGDEAGLYHHTTTTDQAKETNSVVDIGYPYVAVDGNGVSLDEDGDGWADYLEDWNGNGDVDSGETDWEDALDLGLNVMITRPRKGSVIP